MRGTKDEDQEEVINEDPEQNDIDDDVNAISQSSLQFEKDSIEILSNITANDDVQEEAYHHFMELLEALFMEVADKVSYQASENFASKPEERKQIVERFVVSAR